METDKNRRPSVDESVPDGQGRLDRIADQTKGLVDDIKEWIDLKVQLVQMDLEEKFETMANQVLSTFVVILLAGVTVLFALVAASLGLGGWLGHPAWGFLAVTGILTLLTLAIHHARPRIIKAPKIWKKKELPAPEKKPIRGELPPAATMDIVREDAGADVDKS